MRTANQWTMIPLIVASALLLLISTLVALLSGSLLIKKNVQAEAPLDEFKAHMDERIPALMKQYSIPGCNIALVKDGEIAWTEGYGYADVDSGRALTTDTPMSVQSITKSVTAWGVMRLVEKGLIHLDTVSGQFKMDIRGCGRFFGPSYAINPRLRL